MMTRQPKDIDDYISWFPVDVQERLQKLRAAIRKAAPKAEEAIRYMMPTFRLEGNLVHFAALKNHIGFYPAPSGIAAFRKELSKYPTSKGAIQFPIDKVPPLALVTQIVKFRVKENLEKARKKKKVNNR